MQRSTSGSATTALDDFALLGAERLAAPRSAVPLPLPRAVIPLFGSGPESRGVPPREPDAVRDPTLPYRAALRLEGFFGRSAALARVFRRAQPAARLERLQVLITGPSGAGKTALARAIHESGPRAGQPFVEVNCAAVPRELFEAEFFGCTRNAYTQAAERSGRFASAAGGTLLLDEVGEIPLAEQSKLLRVLDEGCYERLGEDRSRRADVRIIAATNRDLQAAVAAGRFRADLYFRLNRYEIRMPSLDERREDIPELVRALAEQQCAVLGLPSAQFCAEALRALQSRSWPGNVRELQSVVAQAVIEASGEGSAWIQPQHCTPESPAAEPLRPRLPSRPGPALGALPGDAAAVLEPAIDADLGAVSGSCAAPAEPCLAGLSYADATRECQRRILAAALAREHWNVTRTARRLGLSRSHLYVLLEEFGLTRPRS